MKKIWHIGWNDIKITVRDKVFFVWTLLFPLVFIFIFGNIFKGDPGPDLASLKVLNHDRGQWGSYFIEKLKTPSIDIQLIEEEPVEYNRILVIPADFSEKIESKEAQEVLLKKWKKASVKAATQVKTKIIQAAAKVITELILHGKEDLSTFFDKKSEFRNIIEIKSQFPKGTLKEIPSGFDHAIPGIMVQFIMMMVLIYGGISVMMDRKNGVLSRILFSSASIPELWGGKFLGRLLMGIIQALILIVTGILFFRLNIGNYFLSLLNVLVFSIAIASLSIFIGSVLKKEDLIIGVSVLLGFAVIFTLLAIKFFKIKE